MQHNSLDQWETGKRCTVPKFKLLRLFSFKLGVFFLLLFESITIYIFTNNMVASWRIKCKTYLWIETTFVVADRVRLSCIPCDHWNRMAWKKPEIVREDCSEQKHVDQYNWLYCWCVRLNWPEHGHLSWCCSIFHPCHTKYEIK